MTIQLYNTMKRAKEEFTPLEEGRVKMYHCGPTVYSRPHIGNYRAFLFADLLRRFFEFKGFDVLQVMNLTDVDDKTIRDSQKEGKTLSEFTEQYVDEFFEDLDTLGAKRAHHYPKATEHIEEMEKMVDQLLDKGLAYQSEGSTYYKIEDFDGYGKLAHLDVEGLKAGARVDSDEYDKASPRDFALWKGYVESDGDVFWESKLGKGRPGWHIECSAMSMRYLGESFDIHTGGVDLIFPHHENEIAQSEGATGHPYVKYWLHNEHFLLDGQKISKSLGNVVSIPELVAQGYDGATIRYALLSSHYRTRFNFTIEEGLTAAKEAIRRLRNFRRDMESVDKPGEEHPDVLKAIAKGEKDFDAALCDDLNTPEALAALFTMIREVNSLVPKKDGAEQALAVLKKADQVLAVIEEEEELLDEDIARLLEEREQARDNKDFARSDEIRDQLADQGIILEDTPSGTRWHRE